MKAPVIVDIQGSWQLISIKIISSDQTIDMFGPNPIGLSVFDSSGYMSTQLGSGSRVSFLSETINQGTSDEIINAFNNYMAFYGKYTEPHPGTLSISIEGCLFPNWQGKEIIRYAEITDNLLYLTTPPTKFGMGDAIVKAVWKRI